MAAVVRTHVFNKHVYVMYTSRRYDPFSRDFDLGLTLIARDYSYLEQDLYAFYR